MNTREMMMAHDSGPTPNGLSAAVIDRVSNALVGYLRHPELPDDALREALHEMADEARQNAMPPERLLVVLKDIWYELPAVSESTDRDERMRLLQRAVTMCINAYYRD